MQFEHTNCTLLNACGRFGFDAMQVVFCLHCIRNECERTSRGMSKQWKKLTGINWRIMIREDLNSIIPIHIAQGLKSLTEFQHFWLCFTPCTKEWPSVNRYLHAFWEIYEFGKFIWNKIRNFATRTTAPISFYTLLIYSHFHYIIRTRLFAKSKYMERGRVCARWGNKRNIENRLKCAVTHTLRMGLVWAWCDCMTNLWINKY